MNPDSVLDYARDVVSTLGGRPASLVTEPSLQAFLAAGTALDLVTHDVEALMTAGQPIPAVLEQQWHSALAGWQQAQNDIKNRLAGYLTAGLPSLPGLDDVARRLSWDDPLGFRGTSSLGPVELTLGAPVVVRHPSFALAPVVIGPARPDLIGAKLGGALGGGGALRVLGDGIAGVLSLSLGAVEVSALASLRRMPATGDASFLAIIGVAFTPGIQLGFGFAITRAGGVIGTNRRADSAALATQLRSGTAGDVLFASDPLHEAARLLPAAEQMFPPARGAHLVGPTFQLSWLKIADATFVSFDLGVLIEFPGPSRLLLLGVARAGIPGPVPLLRLRLDLLGWIDFAQRQTGFDATLVDSGALGIFTIAGDAAFRLSYGDRPYTLLTVGGFYPGFNPEPAQLPPLRRVGLALDAPVPGVSVRVEGYFAVTTNTLQFGGSLECAFDAAGVGAAGFLALDALIQFTPFHFHAVCSAGFRVYALGLTFAGIRLDGTIDGPGPIVISGRLTVETFLHDISWHETFTLGSSGGDTRVPARRLLDALEPELGHAENLRRGGGTDPLVVLAPRAAHGTRAAISPVGTLEWRQRRAPLGIPIDRLEGVPLGSAQGVRVVSPARQGGVTGLFSPGSFITLSVSEALNQPAFDELDAGIVVGWPADLEGPAVPQQAKMKVIRRVLGEPVLEPTCGGPLFARAHPLILMAMLADRLTPAAPSSVAPMVSITNEAWATGDGAAHGSATAAHQYARQSGGGLALPALDMGQPVSLIGI